MTHTAKTAPQFVNGHRVLQADQLKKEDEWLVTVHRPDYSHDKFVTWVYSTDTKAACSGTYADTLMDAGDIHDVRLQRGMSK